MFYFERFLGEASLVNPVLESKHQQLSAMISRNVNWGPQQARAAPGSLEAVAPEGKPVVAADWWHVQEPGGRGGGRRAAAQTVVAPSTFLSPATPGSAPAAVSLLLSPGGAGQEALRAMRAGSHQPFGWTTL